MTTEIKVCMGSACFAKGNHENLETIKRYVEEQGLDAEVKIIGALCENKCANGPRVIVNGVEYNNVAPEQIEKIINNR